MEYIKIIGYWSALYRLNTVTLGITVGLELYGADSERHDIHWDSLMLFKIYIPYSHCTY